MRFAKQIYAIFVSLIIFTLVACGIVPAESSVSRGSEPKTLREVDDYHSLVALYGDDGLVKDNAFANPLENIALLETWIKDYRDGKSGSVAVLSDGMGYPPALYILESNGSATYAITVYNKSFADGSSRTPSPFVYESSIVIERTYDYIFGADFPADILRNVIVVHKGTPPTAGELTLNLQPKLDGISFEAAELRAEEINDQLKKHMSIIPNIYNGGVFIRESIVNAAVDNAGLDFYYKTVGTVKIGNDNFYVIYGNSDQEVLNRGEHSGSVTAVSLDGRLVFIQSMVDGQWIFVDDNTEEKVPSEAQSSSPQPKESELEPRASKILPLGDIRLSFPSDTEIASQKELDKWISTIGSDMIARVDVCNMSDLESELSTDKVNSILEILMSADIKLYDILGNPPTGGVVHIIAYDSDEKILFNATYNGEWFSVSFNGESKAYIFNGEATSLDNLSDLIS